MKAVCALLALSAAATLSAETIGYSWLLVRANGSTERIHTEVRNYTLADIIVDDRGAVDGRGHWSKALHLFGPYDVSVDVYEDKTIDGFGITIDERGNPEGFSWNWFDRLKGDVFIQRRGKGKIRVRMTGLGATVQVASIEFLDNLVLGYNDHQSGKEPGDDSHVLAVSKGSVLRVAP